MGAEVARGKTLPDIGIFSRTEGKRTELLANICEELGATQYVSPVGSAEYLLREMNVLTDAGVETVFQNYKHPEYRQLFPPFIPFASALT